MNENFKLSFRNLNYRVEPKLFSKEKCPKEILKGINGDFNGNELTAIIGLSGSGKSSLLDCLSGFRVENVSGSIAISDSKINIRKCSSYIMQEHNLHEMLTVRETMMLSMNLKNSTLNNEQKNLKIHTILKELSIEFKNETFVKNLSGGEQKRLSMAIELIHDPKVIFLDEPTSGLDNVSSTNCIRHFKQLTIEGRAIIITIHQPTALVLKMFDHVYALADGRCIYDGRSDEIVEFLSESNLVCPSSYNPADFLLEIANNDYGDFNQLLAKKVKNKQNDHTQTKIFSNEKMISRSTSETEELHYTTTYAWQVYYLMLRTFLITSRDKTLFYTRILIHLFLGLVIGILFQGVGGKGGMMLSNYLLLVTTIIILVFTSFHSHFVSFPLEFPIIKREHFNGWYSTRAYYTAFILFDLPITFVCCTAYCAITYYLTDQPRELYRFILFLTLLLGMSFATHVLGIGATALMNVKFATTYGTFILLSFAFSSSALMILAKDTQPIFRYLFSLNYIDYSLKGIANSVLGFDRTKIPCEKTFCFLGNPNYLIHEFGLEIDITKAFGVIFLYISIHHVISFLLIRFRLKNIH